ncbi:TRAP transporter large permease [Ponticoccus alexandrii]|uniref:TRAP transporter large permease protein n=1 Tax=Ponticoccus alexandrii TaxID=1943633 RepID=A0ABX7FER8_9RHOB|nr:TRAP transporter large permease [Ponticoccus alexandrii]ETA49499.1 membrane protein [Rhodobacteraceae bacterium PD-2]QRF68974.1 TRAP transporter large permease subunit [Ponticoccus alexandrii]
MPVVAIGLLLLLILLAVPVGAVLGLLGLVLDQVFTPMPMWRAIGEISWGASTEFTLMAIPLYILLGEIFLRSGIASDMYEALRKWLVWLPGGLMHANIAASTLFAATSGSSVATAATIGTVALPQQKKYGYGERMFLGSIAAGGTLGILIPPSINMIIYGVLTNTSIPQLYLAALLPGLVLATIFMMTIIAGAGLTRSGRVAERFSWAEKRAALRHLLPPGAIFVVIMGSIYAGIATPTEAAGLGVLAALVLAWSRRKLNAVLLMAAFENTMRTTGMIMLIVMLAYFLNFVLTGLGLSQVIADLLSGADLSPLQTILLVIAFYLVLGCVMETLSMMIATLPIVAPIVFAAGYDPVWFGVVMMMLVELAMITPPIGVNLYVVQGVRTSGSIRDVILGSMPFVLAILAMILFLVAMPDVVTIFAGG